MGKYYEDTIIHLKEFSLQPDEDIFNAILKKREGRTDCKRFFLDYIPESVLAVYDLSSDVSVDTFRDECLSGRSPLKLMGGCNLEDGYEKRDIRYAGIKMSDPTGKVLGSFDIRGGTITYSPLFAHFCEERDIVKFANDRYFTTITFEKIMLDQIARASNFYVHVGDHTSVRDISQKGRYILEKCDSTQMTQFVLNPDEGVKVFTKFMQNS